ncbi:putative transcriptional regulator [Desulfoscipio geothermicus DSM 3669]|uniref:Putative transcriptional regulator n=2 Tax=Desulfoscipio geothermicus TaxID=39060 RepID=A0A1I6EHB1_9FIRM|nr:putative transcriptional regulator [Desulfoscipio geothermicus DSM 3669]
MAKYITGDVMAVRNRLKSIRHQHEMNQKEFAQYLGLSAWSYNRYEKQVIQPSLEVALAIAERLKQPVEEIFYRESSE